MRRLRAKWKDSDLDMDGQIVPWSCMELVPRIMELNTYDYRKRGDGVRWTVEHGDGQVLKEGVTESVEQGKALAKVAAKEVLRKMVERIGGPL